MNGVVNIMLYVIASIVSFLALIKVGVFGQISKKTIGGRVIVRNNVFRFFESLKYLAFFLYTTYIGIRQYYFDDFGNKTISKILVVNLLVTTLGLPIIARLTSVPSEEL
ncbi:hypothetical protein [Fusibacter sp. JL216-2]|uniref:hypothetical protein n=1 Tax=Fusibacter sp. JL216-2 TaxID=3071453 RepID=UPI003D356140